MVGTICLLMGWLKYAIIDNDGLVIYYGTILNRKKIRLLWQNIADVKSEKYNIIKRFKSGWSQSYAESYWGVVLQLIQPINLTLADDIFKNERKHIFDKPIEIRADNYEIFLKESPACGFNNLLHHVSRHVNIGQYESKPERFNIIKNTVFGLNIIVILFASMELLKNVKS